MASRFIIFCLLFFVCGHANGARDVQQYKTAYGATKNMKEAEDSSYGPYITQYNSGHNSKEAEVSYITSYGTKEGRKEVETPYLTQYNSGHNSKEAEVPYITSYGTKEGRNEAETPYITQYNSGHNSKEGEVPYITSYGTKEGKKEAETPYITQYNSGHNSKEAEVSYITNYGTKEDTKEAETPYIMSYGTKTGTKEVETPYVMSYGTKEVEVPYITGYIFPQAKKESKEVETPYITGYISAQGKKESKEVETPYITGYISAQGKKESKEVETPYITGYISAQAAKEKAITKCKHHKHVNRPSSDTKNSQEPPLKGHEHHHMHTHSSSPMDHTEAFKVGFFTFDDLYKGKIMPLNFPKQEHSRFLPKEVADSIPFSMPQLPHLLQLFSIPQDSRDAKHMAYALEQCEMKPITGETKFCATSLESMTEFVTKIIGSGVSFNILSTTHPTTSTAITQSYTILEEPKEVLASKMVFCHPMAYPYSVFFCHNFEKDTKFFKVSLEGENEDKVEAMAVCHMDTSDWDPNHSLFGLLGIKAGASSPVCHFFPENHLVWIPSPTKATM
ncbi:PREDICTED: BURP domain-containing protein 9-like [Prunus mume]|uniref:BURP domain-containing protein 9-like n=1 Tax=Prunus mume TaxID=102107 RepID=A0ABM0PAU1_PRUMU|nr:PREDICTED: BURP domain-containing protein 9-like [Prunus mume]